MADSEEFRLKRLKHEERLSRVFDEVMGLGDFAESSRGSASSSRSGGQDNTKGIDETSGQGDQQPVEEEDSNDSRQEEKMDEGTGETSFPHISSPPSVQHPSFTMGTNDGVAGGGSGGAAFDDALDGLPSFGPEEEEEDEDWHFALPMGSLDDGNVDKTMQKDVQTGVKSNTTDQPREEEEEEDDQERGESTESAHTSHSSKDNTPENSRDGGIHNQAEETEDSQEGARSEAAPVEDSNLQTSPAINIKDEPIDEGYDAALLPQSSIRQIKEELESQEEELRISSVYSVGGGNNFAPPTMPAAVPAAPATAIFIPGRGAVIQAMASFPLRPPAPIRGPLTSLLPAPPRAPPPSVVGSVRCSGCSKVLLKGQTAFQRKGSTQLFCSTVCLTGHLPAATKNRSCFQCNREINQPRDMITIPDDGTYVNFCGQFCLSVFRHKKKQNDKAPQKLAEKRPEKKPEKPPEKPVERPSDKPMCSVCKVSNKQIEHEVTHQGRLHRLCSDACFLTWRKMRHLAMNCCEGCGLYCSSSSGSCQTLTIDRSQLNFCGPTCIGTYKQTCRKTTECAYCHKIAVVSLTIMERDQRGKVQLYCSTACVEHSRPPQHTLTGAAFPCCLCKVSAVPQYHLAMVDGTIRNFCSYDCVSVYRKSGDTSQPDLTNGTLRDPSHRDGPKPGPSVRASSVPPIPQDFASSVPYPGHHPSHSSVPPLVPPFPAMSSPSVPGQAQARAPSAQPLKPAKGETSDPSKLTCHQCSKQFSIKPVLFSHQGRISMFCSRTCSEQYKTQKNILVVCEGCKREKVLFDTISYNQQDLNICSESCKLLFKHDQLSCNKDHSWRPCSYCSSINHKMLHSHYGGRLEEFCRPHCMSQYTVLFYGMGRCDSCRNQGYMTEKLQCLGSVRNFCNLPCLLQYCYLHFESSQHTSSNGTGTAPQTPYAPTQPHDSSKMNPVIADVVSLANGSATQPSVSADAALAGAVPTSNADGKNLDHASTQTDAMRVPVPRRRQMKNKSVLCRPFTMDQESMCQLPTPFDDLAALIDSSSQPDRPSVEASSSPTPPPKPQGETQPCNGIPARLSGRHFLGKRETDSDCKVCSHHKRKRVEEEEQERKKLKVEEDEGSERKTEEETKDVNSRDANDAERKEEEEEKKLCEQESGLFRKLTPFYCKTCSGEPSLCPVPCFELYHTKLIYKTLPEVETQELSLASASSSAGEENPKVVLVPVPVPVFIPVPMNMYSQHTPVPMAVPVPVPVPLLVSPQTKDLKDAAVQSELLPEMEEKQKICPVCSAGQSGSPHRDMKSEAAAAVISEGEESEEAVKADVPPTGSSEVKTESADPTPADPTESADPTVADPTVADPTPADPTVADPTPADPTVADPTEADPTPADPTVADPTEADPTPADPTVADPTESADHALTDPSVADPTLADPHLNTQPEETSTSDPPTSSAEHHPPSSPVMDLESDIPSETLTQKSSAPQRGVKRSRDSYSSRKRSRRRTVLNRSPVVTPAASRLNHLYGVKAWKSWVQQQNKQTGSNIVDIKEDILQCDSAELSFALSRFIREVRRPNGEAYSPDSIFYLCLGIQQYLFMKGRIENIFTDELYNQFATKISGMLRLWKPKPLPGGGAVSSRVVESYLWECKQLGAYSPIVLLNTLLFFCAKNFGFTTLAQHQSLSFSNFTRHTKPGNRAGEVHYLRYQGSSSATPHTERTRKRQGEEKVELEMLENVANPLHCPVRLYEFYLSRCPESVKRRTDVFFLQPEQNVHTHSPYWYTSQPLEGSTLQSMLTRILAVREVHQHLARQAAQRQSSSTSADTDTLQ